MFTVTSKNRATEIETNMTREKVEAFAIRCTMAESNPKVIYTVN